MAFYDSDDCSWKSGGGYDSDDYDDDDYYHGSGDDDEEAERCGGGGSAKMKEEEVKCECKKCRQTELGKHTLCDPKLYTERSKKIEQQQLAEYTERNGHLAKHDPLRHACGNGAVEKRRYCLLSYRSFCVHAPNPSHPLPYMETHGGGVWPFGRPKLPGEVKHDERFCQAFKTPEGMTIQDYERLIDDYHHHHEMMNTPFAAFSRHHMLAMASLSSTCATLESRLWETKRTGFLIGSNNFQTDPNSSLVNYSPNVSPANNVLNSNAYFHRAFVVAKKHAHDLFQITRFTQMTRLQRNMVLAHSGIAGILISRLFMPTSLPYEQYAHTHKMHVKQSRLIARRVHSKQESEIFADNRYGKADKHDPPASATSEPSIIVDTTTTVDAARVELREIYSNEIHAFMDMIRVMKRGFLNSDKIISIHSFQRMIKLWIYCTKKLMAIQQQFNTETKIKSVVDIMSIAAEFPLLYSSEILSISSNSIANLIKTSIAAFIRMSSNEETHIGYPEQGCRAGLLAFAAVEPRMVDQYLAPRLMICGFDGNDRQEALQNHVPSRCPFFGELRKKFQVHMPRTGDCEWELCRKNGGKIKSFIPYNQA